MSKNRYKDEKVKNFYYLLAYAFDDEKVDFKNIESFGTEHFNNIYDLFSVVLYIRMNRILKEGLYGEYVDFREKTQYVKGRININYTIKKNTLNTQNKVICDYDDYSINNLLNQIVKTTIYNMLKQDILESNKFRLRKLYYELEGIDIIKDIKMIQWSKIKFNRLNNRYQTIIKICKYVLNNLIINKSMENDQFEIIDDNQAYHQLFEKFIRNYLKIYYTRYRKIRLNNIKIKSERMKWNYDEDKEKKNIQYIPMMHTDITIEFNNNVKIIDAKFYSDILSSKAFKGYEKKRINSNNWYQINSYVTNKKYELEKKRKLNKNVSGMLLYARN